MFFRLLHSSAAAAARRRSDAGGDFSSVTSLIATLKACSSSRDLEGGRRAHLAAIESGHDSNIYVATTLVSMFAKCGSLADARDVFDRMPQRNVVAWNALLIGLVDNGQSENALQLFSRMRSEERTIRPNARSYCAAICACSSLAVEESGSLIGGKIVKLKCLEKGMSVHSEALKNDCIDTFTATALVNLYVKCGSLVDARRVFDRIARPDVASWNAMMLGYAVDANEADSALELFERMMNPDVRSYTAAVMACATLAEREEGKAIQGKIVKLSCLEKGMRLHSRALQSGSHDMFVDNSLIDMYAKCGSVADANRVFQRMNRRDVVAWTAIITGLAENDENEEALRLLSLMMLDHSCPPNARTYVAVLTACANMVALDTGKVLHSNICRAGIDESELVANALVDFYGKCGSIVEAELVFYGLETRDVVMWNALLAGYSRQGDTIKVFDLFREFRASCLKPDGTTYLSVLTACSHAGLVRQGRECFAEIEKPGVEHCHCMADLLSRANHLEEAVELLKNMPYKATAVAWKSVLGACRKWGNVEVGRLAFELLVSLDGELATAYVLMGNIYGGAGMWEERDKVMQKLKTRRTSDALT